MWYTKSRTIYVQHCQYLIYYINIIIIFTRYDWINLMLENLSAKLFKHIVKVSPKASRLFSSSFTLPNRYPFKLVSKWDDIYFSSNRHYVSSFWHVDKYLSFFYYIYLFFLFVNFLWLNIILCNFVLKKIKFLFLYFYLILYFLRDLIDKFNILKLERYKKVEKF